MNGLVALALIGGGGGVRCVRVCIESSTRPPGYLPRCLVALAAHAQTHTLTGYVTSLARVAFDI